jgi:nucleoside phosphorylase
MKSLKVLLINVLLGLMIISLSIGVIAAEEKIIIHHTAAFGGELEMLKELMTTTYGEPMVVEGELGRVYYVWETGSKTKLVGSITQTSMQNATLSPALILYTLPEELCPDLVTHGGICGAVWEESKIMDVYAPYAIAFSTQGRYGAEGFSPFGMSTWNSEIGDFFDRDHRPIWIVTDPVLTELLAKGFNDAIEDPGFQELWVQSGLPYQPSLYEGFVQVASNYFVANDELNASWSELYRMDPDTIDVTKVWGDYDGQVHEVGGLDMETAAVVWTFKQVGIPTAVLRYPSDLARAKASVQIQQFGQTASAIGGYAFYYGLQNVITAIEEGLLTVEDGRCVLSTALRSSGN